MRSEKSTYGILPIVKCSLMKGLKSITMDQFLQRRLTLSVMIVVATIQYPECFEPEQRRKGYTLVKGITFVFGKARVLFFFCLLGEGV